MLLCPKRGFKINIVDLYIKIPGTRLQVSKIFSYLKIYMIAVKCSSSQVGVVEDKVF